MPNSNSIAQAVEDAARLLGINRHCICPLLSNNSKYMVAAGTILKSLYLKLVHATCHLLHNCSRKVKSHFEDVDQLITKTKLAAVKNKTRQAKIATIGCPTPPVVTRWES